MKTISDSGDELKSILYNSTSRERSLIYYILGTSRDERESIMALDGQRILEALGKRLKGSLRDLCKALFTERINFDVEMLKKAAEGHTPNEETFYEILFNRPNAAKKDIISKFEAQTGQSLDNFLSTRFHKYTNVPMTKLLKMNRCEEHRLEKALSERAANSLVAVGCDDWINNEEILNYFGQLTPAELLLMGRLYKEKTGKHILNVIDTIGSKHKQVLFRTLYYVVVNPAEYFAKKIHEAVAGLGTDEYLLTRVIVSRYDVDMVNIKKYYYDMYQESIRQAIDDDCSGSYKRLLIGLVHQLDNNEF